MAIIECDDKQLDKYLREVLETWPLYRKLEYKGAEGVKTVPAQLSLFCEHCKLKTSWWTDVYEFVSRAGDRRLQNHKHGPFTKEYKCRNCGTVSVTYYLHWFDLLGVNEFCKVGQYPPLEEEISQSLGGALDAEDRKLYKHGLRLRNFNLGIAAIAYMRRVVENRMNDMLEILREAARLHGAAPEVLARHEEVKADRRFSIKIDYAGDLIPKNLRPDGHPNPIAVLHELASDGLHTKTDEECVDIFDECRATFEYVFGKMRIEAEDAKKFVKDMVRLAEKRAKAGEQKTEAV